MERVFRYLKVNSVKKIKKFLNFLHFRIFSILDSAWSLTHKFCHEIFETQPMWGHTLNQLILAINTALGESALSQRWVWNALSIRVNILYWRMTHLIYFWCFIFSWWGWNKITWILHFLWYLILHGSVGILSTL